MRGETSAWAVIQEAGARKRWKQEQKMNPFVILLVPPSTNTPWELWGQNLADRLKIDVPSIMYCNSFYESHLNYLIPCFLLLEWSIFYLFLAFNVVNYRTIIVSFFMCWRKYMQPFCYIETWFRLMSNMGCSCTTSSCTVCSTLK